MALCLTGISHEPVTVPEIKLAIICEAVRQDFPADIALGVAYVESRYNPRAVGRKHEQGLFQLRSNKARTASFRPTENIREGIKELTYWRTRCPVKEQATYIICYNGGFRHPKYPLKHPYYRNVMKAIR